MRPAIRPLSQRSRSLRRRLDGDCNRRHGHHVIRYIGVSDTFERGRKGGKTNMLQDAGTATATAAADGLIKDTTTQTFVKDVIEESKRQPVLIDFWAECCGPCKQLTPVLEKAVKAAKGKVKLVKMNIHQHPAIPGQMGIQAILAVIASVHGQPA